MNTRSRAIDCSIGVLSERTGVHIETIRYYERIELMPAPPRTQGRQRVYDASHLKRLIFIRRTRELGFSVEEIRGLLRLVDGGSYTCAEVNDIAVRHLHGISSKIADLKKLSNILSSMASQCTKGLVPECPIIDALSDGEGQTFSRPIIVDAVRRR